MAHFMQLEIVASLQFLWSAHYLCGNTVRRKVWTSEMYALILECFGIEKTGSYYLLCGDNDPKKSSKLHSEFVVAEMAPGTDWSAMQKNFPDLELCTMKSLKKMFDVCVMFAKRGMLYANRIFLGRNLTRV
jgi:hypothetical protein